MQVDECSTPGTQGRRLVPVGWPDGDVEEGALQVDDTEILATMDVVCEILQ